MYMGFPRCLPEWLGARLSQARETTLDNTITAAPRVDLIHPGVLRYLREIKLVQ